MISRNCFSSMQQQTALWTDMAVQTGEMLAASSQVSGLCTGRTAGARIGHRGLLPIHAAATANARRLAGG